MPRQHVDAPKAGSEFLTAHRAQAPQVDAFLALCEQRWPFLQSVEDCLLNRSAVFLSDLSEVTDTITTPGSLQHVGEQIGEITTANWTSVEGLNTAVAYFGELAAFWEMVFERHRGASAVFRAAERRPYCLFLRSFTNVGSPVELPFAAGRAMIYLNTPELDANLSATLMNGADWLNPVSCMHTDDMQLLARSKDAMPAFRVQTITWPEIMGDAIKSAGSIVLYVDKVGPGVSYELDQIREFNMESRTIIVYRGDDEARLDYGSRLAGLLPIADFVQKGSDATGAGILTAKADGLLRGLASRAKTRTPPSQRLRDLQCEVVDPGAPAGFDLVNPATSYFVTENNSSAFVRYVRDLPDSFLRWNEISQDMRLRGIQPKLDTLNELYLSLRMAFLAACCLGFTSSIAVLAGLLSKVASIVKTSPPDNKARVERYMRIIDTAHRFDALTERHAWREKLEAYRQSIISDPFMENFPTQDGDAELLR